MMRNSNFRWPFNSGFIWWVRFLLVVLAVPLVVLHALLGAWDGVGRGLREVRAAWKEIHTP